MTIIALDYDGTYTEDPILWKAFITHAHNRGHTVHIVTMRHDNESERIEEEFLCKVFYTARAAKMQFMKDLGYEIDIWIDDMPYLIANIPIIK